MIRISCPSAREEGHVAPRRRQTAAASTTGTICTPSGIHDGTLAGFSLSIPPRLSQIDSWLPHLRLVDDM